MSGAWRVSAPGALVTYNRQTSYPPGERLLIEARLHIHEAAALDQLLLDILHRQQAVSSRCDTAATIASARGRSSLT